MSNDASSILADLLAVATGKTRHVYMGLCPDELQGSDVRDPECPACRALVAAGAALAQQQPVAIGAGLDLTPLPGISAEDCNTSPITDVVTLLERWSKGEHHYSINVEDSGIGKLTVKHVLKRAAFWAPRLHKALHDVERALYRLEVLENRHAVALLAAADPCAPWLSEAHSLCADHGIPPGNITERLRALRELMEQPAATVAGLTLTDQAADHIAAHAMDRVAAAQGLEHAMHLNADITTNAALRRELIRAGAAAAQAAPTPAPDADLMEALDELASDLGYEGNCEGSQEKMDRSALIDRAVRALKAQAAPAQQPLSDEQIAAIVDQMSGNEPTAGFWRDLVHAVEHAHGIVGAEQAHGAPAQPGPALEPWAAHAAHANGQPWETVLTVAEIADLAEFAGLTVQRHADDMDMESEIAVLRCPPEGVTDDEGTPRHYEHIAYYADYPDEGCGPLGEEIPAPGAEPAQGELR